MIVKTPIVLIAFNRSELVRLSLRNVSLANGAADRDAFMFIDGPRNDDDAVENNKIVSIATKFKSALPRLEIIRRDHNYGCRGNIVDAISQVLSRYGQAVIIEDDILVSRTFFDYMDKALDFYNDDKSIWSINAYQNPNMRIPKDYPYDVYLNPVNMCWGWGTWADRWRGVDFDIKDWPSYRSNPAFMERLNKAGRQIAPMLDSQYNGHLKTWDVQCTYHVVKNNLMSIEPRFQLSKNIGYSSLLRGEHTNEDCPYVTRQKYYNFMPRLQAKLCHDPRIFSQYEWVGVPKNLSMRIFRKIRRMFAYVSSDNLEPLDV